MANGYVEQDRGRVFVSKFSKLCVFARLIPKSLILVLKKHQIGEAEGAV
jgi:hypothetical protein